MTIKFTVEEVNKDHIKVKFDDNRVVPIPVRTWWDKSRIEAEIRLRFNEEDLGTVDKIPYKVGESHEIITTQEQEVEFNKASEEQQKEIASYTFPYRILRRIEYPYYGEQLGALVKAVLTGDKTELEEIEKLIQNVKNKYPKDDKKYTMEERRQAINNSDELNHFDDRVRYMRSITFG